mgnify:CR=1 FL=1
MIYDHYHTNFEELSLSYQSKEVQHLMVENISVDMTISKNLEPLHPIHPTVLVSVSFKDCIRLYMDMDIINMSLHHMFTLLTQVKNQSLLSIVRKVETKEIQESINSDAQ